MLAMLTVVQEKESNNHVFPWVTPFPGLCCEAMGGIAGHKVTDSLKSNMLVLLEHFISKNRKPKGEK